MLFGKCEGFFTSITTTRNMGFKTQLLCTPVMQTIQTKPKVPASAWKWPASWPFPVDFLELIDVDVTNKTVLSQPVMSIFQQHIQNNLFDGASTLEIGHSNLAYLKAIEQKDSKLESCEISKVTEILPYDSATFDRIVITSGIESLSDPRSLFREIWRVLKPGGSCITCFSEKVYYPFQKSAKMWTTMNDEQKIWIAGSYFHYSAGAGWEGIEGYDLLGSTGEQNMIFELDSQELQSAAYIVSANKIIIPTMDSPDFSAYNFSKSTLVGAACMDKDDREFTALRLQTEFSQAGSTLEKQIILDSIPKLSSIYEVLRGVKEVVIPTPVKAMLAVFLLPKWDDTEAQREALKLGLGLGKGNEEFWGPLGACTSAMPPREKILFLSEIIPEFGKNLKLEKLPDLLSQLLVRIREKIPGIEEASLQIFVADLAVTDFLQSSSSDQNIPFSRVLKFIDVSEVSYLTELIAARMTATLK
jgi:hypothetical protein